MLDRQEQAVPVGGDHRLVLQNVTASIEHMRMIVILPKQLRPGQPDVDRVISLTASQETPASRPVKQHPSVYIVTTLSMLSQRSSIRLALFVCSELLHDIVYCSFWVIYFIVLTCREFGECGLLSCALGGCAG
jgi:hypothetical protein